MMTPIRAKSANRNRGHLSSMAEDHKPHHMEGKSTPPRWLLLLALCVVQFSFGGYAIVLKAFAQKADINALFFSLCRDICCFPVLLVAAKCTENVRVPRFSEVPLFFFLGATGMFSNQIFFIWGLYYTSPNVASIFQPAVPVFTALLAYLTCYEPLTVDKIGLFKVFGILCATGGAATMVASEGFSGGKHHNFLIGTLFLILNTFSMAGYILVQKRFIFTPGSAYYARWCKHPVSVTAWAYGFGSLCMCFAATYYIRHDRSVFHFDRELWPPLVYAIFMSSALAYGLLTWANKYLSSTIVTAFWPVQVPATVVMSWIFFQNDLTALQGVGAVLITGGLFSVTHSNRLSLEAAAAAATDAQQRAADPDCEAGARGYSIGNETDPILTSVTGTTYAT